MKIWIGRIELYIFKMNQELRDQIQSLAGWREYFIILTVNESKSDFH